MRLTSRDRSLLEDIALHHVMSRDQVVRLGYFGSVQRANARLLALRRAKLLALIAPELGLELRQHLYHVTRKAAPWLQPRIASLVTARRETPQFIEHALGIVHVRIELQRLGLLRWLAEPQIRHRYETSSSGVRRLEDFRPDGLAVLPSGHWFIELDRGHVSLTRMRERLNAYERYVRSGLFGTVYSSESANLLIVTTGRLRSSHLQRLVPCAPGLTVRIMGMEELRRLTTLGAAPL